MDKSYELKHHRLEGSHWWFEARRDMILRLLKKERKDSKILDVGCAGGSLVKFLKEAGFNGTRGIDTSGYAIRMCKKKGVNDIANMDGTAMKYGNGRFDIVIASDILEHIENDGSALAEWNRVLKPGGKLIVFVPAFDFLWSSHDEVLHHLRRYTKKKLVSALKSANFDVKTSSHWNFGLFFPASLVRIPEHFLKKCRKKKDQLYEMNAATNMAIVRLLKFENWLISKGVKFPVGISVFAVAGKRQRASDSKWEEK